MLTFEQKLEILESYPALQRKNVSLKRVNFHYEESVHDKKIVAFHLHPNGNGFVYAGLLQGYPVDEKGFVNIRDFSADELRTILDKSIQSLSIKKVDKSAEIVEMTMNLDNEGESWNDENGHSLILKREDDLWYVYSGLNLEMVFTTREEAEHYLTEEGFSSN